MLFHTREALLRVMARVCVALTCVYCTRDPSHAKHPEKIYCSLMRYTLGYKIHDKTVSDEQLKLYIFV